MRGLRQSGEGGPFTPDNCGLTIHNCQLFRAPNRILRLRPEERTSADAPPAKKTAERSAQNRTGMRNQTEVGRVEVSGAIPVRTSHFALRNSKCLVPPTGFEPVLQA